jgi:hypothetical protein
VKRSGNLAISTQSEWKRLLKHPWELLGKPFEGVKAIGQIAEQGTRRAVFTTELKRGADLDAAAKQVLYTKLHEIAQRNTQRFFNGLFDQVIEEYKTNLDRAMTIMNQNCTGAHRARIQQLLQQN